MNLFGKERDLIHRIANLILILWLVGATFVFYTNLVDVVIKKPNLTYEEYQIEYCNDLKPIDGLTDDEYCQRQYEQNKITIEDDEYYNKKGLMDAIGNVVIVGIFLFLLNRKEKNV